MGEAVAAPDAADPGVAPATGRTVGPKAGSRKRVSRSALCVNLRLVDQHNDAELAELAALLRQRNALDARIGHLLDRPAHTGSIGEWIAARVFDIELEKAANAAGFDGHFISGALAGRTVNVKAYTRLEWMLDINPNAPLDYYLVFTGPISASVSSRGTLRPFCIDGVFLFDAQRLHGELVERGVKIGIATSVRAVQWSQAQIYPEANNSLLVLSQTQRSQLEIFACD
jgi:hypothetical protein